jgi:hypothetical protein
MIILLRLPLARMAFSYPRKCTFAAVGSDIRDSAITAIIIPLITSSEGFEVLPNESYNVLYILDFRWIAGSEALFPRRASNSDSAVRIIHSRVNGECCAIAKLTSRTGQNIALGLIP